MGPLAATLEAGLKAVVGLALFLMMATTTADVFARYVFAAPIHGAYEIVQVLCALLLFSALPLVTRAERHIDVALFDHAFRGATREIRRVLVLLASALVMAGLAFRIWLLAGAFAANRQVLGAIEIPLAPLAYAIAVLAAATASVLVAMLAAQVRGWLVSPRRG